MIVQAAGQVIALRVRTWPADWAIPYDAPVASRSSAGPPDTPAAVTGARSVPPITSLKDDAPSASFRGQYWTISAWPVTAAMNPESPPPPAPSKGTHTAAP